MRESNGSPIGARVMSLVYDCSDPEALAAFYARLLGGTVESDPYGGHLLAVEGLGLTIGFQADEDYAPPVWLGSRGEQQPMAHIDIAVANRQEAVDYALSLGAVLPERQFCQPDWDVQWTTLLDPAGHPFCIFEA